MTQKYTYIGDKLTAPHLKNTACTAVKNNNNKCIRGKNGNMLVLFANSEQKVVVKAMALRKIK
jgi:gluconate kinase